MTTIDTLRTTRAALETDCIAQHEAARQALAAAERRLNQVRAETPVLIRLAEIDAEREALEAQLMAIRAAHVSTPVPALAEESVTELSTLEQQETDAKDRRKAAAKRRKAKAKREAAAVVATTPADSAHPGRLTTPDGTSVPLTAGDIAAVYDALGGRTSGLLVPPIARSLASVLGHDAEHDVDDAAELGQYGDRYTITEDGGQTITLTVEADGLTFLAGSAASAA